MVDLKAFRQLAGLTQAQMGALLGILQPNNYNRLETGKRKLTRQQAAHVGILTWLYTRGLLPAYMARITNNNRETKIK